MNECFSHIYGHKRQILALSGMLERGTIPQGLVFSGAEHIGKAMVARALAASILGVLESDLARHPDFISMQPVVRDSGSKAYDLDDIRDMLGRLGQSAMHGQTVAIIDDADVLSTAGQNALLKTLEEPTGKTVVILVVHELASMLPTILSRVVTIPFFSESDQPISDECAADVKNLSSSSLVERLKAAQALGKRDAVDIDALFVALLQTLKHQQKYSSKALNAVLKARERIAANGNFTIALEQLVIQLGTYE